MRRLFKLSAQPEITLKVGKASWERHERAEAEGVAYSSTTLTFEEDSELISFFEKIEVAIPEGGYKWTPTLCPHEGDVIGDHCFRSPAVILQKGGNSFALVPDLETIKEQRKKRVSVCLEKGVFDTEIQSGDMKLSMALERKAEGHAVSYGFAEYDCMHHVYYRLNGNPIAFKAGTRLTIAYYILESDNTPEHEIRKVLAFLWDMFAKPYVGLRLPRKLSFEEYAEASCRGVMETDEYLEKDLGDGLTVSGFCLAGRRQAKTASEASGFFGDPHDAIWFHEWFNSFRTAFGLWHHARKRGDAIWQRRAENIKNLLLSAPDASGKGFIPSLYDFATGDWWNGAPNLGAGKDIYDVSASAHTAQWMLRWDRHIGAVAALSARAGKLAASLIAIQQGNGAFPGFVGPDGAPLDLLNNSSQGAMASLFLCELHEIKPEPALLKSILKACEFYIREIIPESRFHDFETFFSCSSKPLDFHDHRTGQHAQNNLSLFWIAHTLLKAHAFTQDKELLKWGLICLDRLSLYQQVWNPPYISLYTFGGFGSMNTDGEWNDTRQVFFSEAYFDAYRLAGLKEYLERGTAALDAGYALLCHPAHKDINPLAYNKYPVGLVPENFAHNCQDGRAMRSSFDWDGGALMAMSAWTELRHPDISMP